MLLDYLNINSAIHMVTYINYRFIIWIIELLKLCLVLEPLPIIKNKHTSFSNLSSQIYTMNNCSETKQGINMQYMSTVSVAATSQRPCRPAAPISILSLQSR